MIYIIIDLKLFIWVVRTIKSFMYVCVCISCVYIAVYNIYAHIYHCIDQFKYAFLKSLDFKFQKLKKK